jgi:hypothetical protein
VNATSTKQQLENPADFIQAWGRDNIEEAVPSPEELTEVGRALHAVDEFLVDPIKRALEKITNDLDLDADGKPGRIPEDERPVTYADIGLLIIWTDELRKDCSILLDRVCDIALLAHEELQSIVEGYVPDIRSQAYDARLRRFHGLGETF